MRMGHAAGFLGEDIVKVKAERVSRKKDGKTWCRPSEGYQDDSVEIDLDDYDEVASLAGPLPENDAKWPKGAPFTGVFRYEDKIFKMKAAP